VTAARPDGDRVRSNAIKHRQSFFGVIVTAVGTRIPLPRKGDSANTSNIGQRGYEVWKNLVAKPSLVEHVGNRAGIKLVEPRTDILQGILIHTLILAFFAPVLIGRC
jgi:hypothetical protein